MSPKTELIKTYGGNGWGLLDFLTVPRENRNGMNYLSLLLHSSEGTLPITFGAPTALLDSTALATALTTYLPPTVAE